MTYVLSMRRVGDLKLITCTADLQFFERSPNVFYVYKAFWDQTYDELGSSRRVVLEDILNKKLIMLFDKEEFVACMANGIFDLRIKPLIESSYFSHFSGEFKYYLSGLNEKIMSFGGLMVKPDWRRKNTDVSVVEVLLGLCVESFLNEKMDIAVACSRSDLKVSDKLLHFGFEHMGYSELNGGPVAFSILNRDAVKKHPDKKVINTIKRLQDARHVSSERLLGQGLSL